MKRKETDNEKYSDKEEEISLVERKYDPNSSTRIICIELENNQFLYVRYNENSTIKDLIMEITKRREYKLFCQQRNLILNSRNHYNCFDFSLCFYDKIKPDYENRLKEDVKIDELHIKGLLKNYRKPFVTFRENFTPTDYIYNSKLELGKLKQINDSKFNLYAMYKDYLPRMIKYVPNILNAHPELEDYFRKIKKGYNEFSAYRRNKLTCDDDSIDWFIYDRESVNFLLEMNKIEFTEISNLKYIKGVVYFEDKCDFQERKTTFNEDNGSGLSSLKSVMANKITGEKLGKALINITIDVSRDGSLSNPISKKFELTTEITAFDLLKKMSDSLRKKKEEFGFKENTKILKVKSRNDYIFDLNEKLINYVYVNECVKNNQTPEYLILDNPETEEENNDLYEDRSESVQIASPKKTGLRFSCMPDIIIKNLPNMKEIKEGRRPSKSTMPLPISQGKNDLENIASFSQTPSQVINNISNPLILLEKVINKDIVSDKSAGNKNFQVIKSKSNLDILVESISEEINKKISNDYKGGTKSKTDSKENNSGNNNNDDNYNLELLKEKKNSFLGLNFNGSEYFGLKKKYKKFHELHKPINIFTKKTREKPSKNKRAEIINQRIRKKVNKEEVKEPLIIPTPLINRNEIPISVINRQFSILLRKAIIQKIFNSDQYETKFTNTVLLFKFELFCSTNPLGESKQIRWKTKTKVQNPTFNKRIYFNVNYNTIPNCCSLLMKVSFVQYDKNKQVFKNNVVLWANYRLFDEKNRLKAGLHKVNLHERGVSDDVYYLFNDNPDEENSSKIYFEIENFVHPVTNNVNYSDLVADDDVTKGTILHEYGSDMIEKIIKISEKTPFDDLNNSEKNILWNYRFSIPKISPNLIPRLFLSCEFNNQYKNQQLKKLFGIIPDLTPVQAIDLLSGFYVNDLVRGYAVNVLQKGSFTEISHYLLQLVQALKYEKNIDNPLARFLLEQAIAHPITVGHEFFWHLRAEMFNQHVQQKFGLYLEVFVSRISEALYKIFRDEDHLLKQLVIVADKVKQKVPKEQRDKTFREDLEKINEYLRSKNREVSLPLNFKYRIKGIKSANCRVMKSKKKPLWLTFQNADPLGEDIVVMLKCGDDLRMDMVTLQLFKAMQTLWFENGLKVKMSLYKVLCTGNEQGMLEMVTNSETLAGIHVKQGSALGQMFFDSYVKKWIEKNASVSFSEAVDNFLISNVAYCLATFILGIGDRHNDNIMVKKNGELFHIDFGHFLGHFKYKMGFKRERVAFVFTKQFQYVLGDDNSEIYKKFKEKLTEGYLILRKNKDIIVSLMRILLCTGIPELNEKSLKFLEDSLSMRKDDKAAEQYLLKKLQETIESFSTKFNFAIHIIANK